jgi:UDP-glucose 4-epimerase
MKVLVTGMGGELGTRVAQLLEEEPGVTEIVGVDFVPPRRRLRRAVFRRIDPRRRERLVEFVTEVAPEAVVHVGVYEPAARMGAASAAERTELATVAALSAAARAGRLRHVVVRSGIEIYGVPAREGSHVPDESVPPRPTSPFGVSQLQVETIAFGIGRRHDVPVASLRLAPVSGSHVPSPLGRMLRLPAVPVPALSDPPFCLVHPADAARAIVAALRAGHSGPLNVVGAGAASPWQAVRLGGRVPVPVLPPLWPAAARMVELAGAAIAPHVIELMRNGRAACGARAAEVLDLGEVRSTQEILTDLFEWASVVPMAQQQGQEDVA